MTAKGKAKAFVLPARDVLDLAALGEVAHFGAFFTHCRDREAATAAEARGEEVARPLPPPGKVPVAAAAVASAGSAAHTGGGSESAAGSPVVRTAAGGAGGAGGAGWQAPEGEDIAALDDADVQSILTAGQAAREDVIDCRHPATGRGALHVAAVHGHARLVAMLAANGADVDATDDDGWTPLMYAAAAGQAATGDTLLALGASVAPVSRPPDAASAWTLARRARRAAIEVALEPGTRAAAAAGAADAMEAAAAGHVLWLLVALADSVTSDGGPADLGPVAARGAGGTFELTDDTPVAHARRSLPPRFDAAKAPGAVLMRDAQGRTPLLAALGAAPYDAARHGAFAEALLRRGAADPTAADAAGWTGLMLAARRADAAMVELLLLCGGDPRATREPGDAAAAEMATPTPGAEPAAADGEPSAADIAMAAARTAAEMAAAAGAPVLAARLKLAAAEAEFESLHATRDAVPFGQRPAFVARVQAAHRQRRAAAKAHVAAQAAAVEARTKAQAAERAAAERAAGSGETPGAAADGDAEEEASGEQ